MGDVVLEVVNQVAVITLNRPKALNALTHEMVRRLHLLLDEALDLSAIRAVLMRGTIAEAFCAGGDVIAVAQSLKDGTALRRDFFVDEYRLGMRIHTFPKPMVAFMHGVVMGGGMGLAQGASLRLTASTLRMAMPETRIGLIPDVGASYFFSRMPEPVACYLALTGATIGASDALLLQLADARCKVDDPQELPLLLGSIDWDARHPQGDAGRLRMALSMERPAPESPVLARRWDDIYRHFYFDRSLSELVMDLNEDGSNWAMSTLRILRCHSPLMLALTCVSLKRGRELCMADCFQMEYGFIQHALSCGDFAEGVRALLIDKDKNPKWPIARIEDLQPSVVEEAVRLADGLSRSITL